ncbi:MAG: pitrilysin family protein [Chitinophagaceae bacterium]
MLQSKYIGSFIFLLIIQALSFGQTPSAVYKLPPFEKTVLKNGLTIYLMEQHEVPVIDVSVIMPAGAIYDNPQQSGIAVMTAASLKLGTKNMSKAKLEEELDFLGAEVATDDSKESAYLKAKFAAKDSEKVLNIIRDILLTPVFDTTEFEKQKKLLVAQLERAKESPRNVIGEYFDQVMYRGHVYSNPTNGTIATVTRLTAADAQKFYKTYYIPNGSAFAIVGDFVTKDMKAKLTSLFSTWQKGSVPSKATDNLSAASNESAVLLVNKDDAKETTFFIGGQGVPRNNPDFVAMEVVNTVFGGRFTSWLNDELRVNSGLTYGATSGFNRLKSAGTFRISTFTATKNTEAAIDKTLEVLKRLHTNGIDEKTLASAKNYVKGQYPPRHETSEQLAGLLTQMFWYDFDESFINNFQKNVDGLTLEKAKQVIAKYFPRDKLQFVMVGKAADIRAIAAKYGKVTEGDIKNEVLTAF